MGVMEERLITKEEKITTEDAQQCTLGYCSLTGMFILIRCTEVDSSKIITKLYEQKIPKWRNNNVQM